MSKKTRIRRIIFTIMAVMWMMVIFAFSSRDAIESTEESNRVGMFLGKMVVRNFDAWPESEQEAFAKKWDHPVRKAAHMTEYAILGVLLMGACAAAHPARVALLLSALYASTDEIHQLFVPGRAGMVTDVLYDTAGAAIGIGIVVVAVTMWEKRKQRGRH